jgi:Ca2+-binding RTX toxin-like protein
VPSILRSGRFWALVQGTAALLVVGLAVADLLQRPAPQDSDGISVQCVVPGGSEARVILRGDGAGVTIVRGPQGEVVAGGVQCFNATVSRIDRIVAVGGADHQSVTIDLTGGPFAPGATPEAVGDGEIEFEVSLGAGEDRVTIRGSDQTDGIVLGSDGINLNAPIAGTGEPDSGPQGEPTGDADVTVREVEEFMVRSGEGGDLVSAAGEDGTGDPLQAAVEIDAGLGGDTVEGGLAGDSLLGSAGADGITAGPGDDVLLGLGGIDTLEGGEDADRLDGGVDDDRLRGGPGDDEERGGDGADVFLQDPGDGADVLLGGPGEDAVDYRRRVGRIRITPDGTADDGESGEGDDVGPDVEHLVGGSAGDVLGGNQSANRLVGGPGNDVLRGGLGDDVLLGGPGADTADYSDAGGSVEVDLGDRRGIDDRAGRDRLRGMEDALGGPGADSLAGNDGPNELRGGPGEDDLDGRGGDDALLGGHGEDSLLGSDGSDVLTGEEGADDLDGGQGRDLADYGDAPGGVEVDLGDGDVSDDGHGASDSVVDVEDVAGSAFGDSLRGDHGDNVLAGRDSDDVLVGRGGRDDLRGGEGTDRADYGGAQGGVDVDLGAGEASDDGDGASDLLGGIEDVTGGPGRDGIVGDGRENALAGGSGEDVVDGGAGADDLSGGDGTDVVTYEDASGGVTVNLRRSLATEDGSGASDSLVGFERVIGSAFDDAIVGDSFNNVLRSGEGADRIAGGVGGDRLEGGPQDDDLDGGPGLDTCLGGQGSDGFDRCEVAAQ